MLIYELFQLPFTKSSVTFDLRYIESPNWCQNVGFFVLSQMNTIRLTFEVCLMYDVRNIRKTRPERRT